MAIPKNALRAYRAKHKLSADEVAGMLGIARSTLRSYENGHREVDAETALKIEDVLGIDRLLIRPDLFRRCREVRAA